MIVVEHTHWPLIVVGALPVPLEGSTPTPPDLDRLWTSEDLRLAVVIRGDPARAWIAQAEVFAWLASHRARLMRCVSRAAWIVEDESMRRNADRWLGLIGDRLFRGDAMTFRTVREAIAWLTWDGLALNTASESDRSPDPWEHR